MSSQSSPYRNRILARLPDEQLALLRPHLNSEDLPVRKQLELRNKPIENIYFIESGLASVVANGAGKRSIEVGIIGTEGMTGLTVVMGVDRSPHETFMQIAGDGLSMSARALLQAIDQSPPLHRSLLLYGNSFFNQTAQTALANGRSKLEERLARWLLMAQDRTAGDDLPLTHEFLSVMLGVRRPGVTVSLNLLENAGLITTKRGVITIVDREGLLEAANGAYTKLEPDL